MPWKWDDYGWDRLPLVFDIETDGLIKECTVVHTLTIYDLETGEYTRYDKERASEGIWKLHGRNIIGHNIIGYDIQALKKLYPGWKPDSYMDSMVLARLLYPEVKKRDLQLLKKGKFPGNLVGRHTLKAWGLRLGDFKGDFDGPWDTWTQEMSDYCEQDVRVTVTLLNKLLTKLSSIRSAKMEMDVATVVCRQMAVGVSFDNTAAQKLFGVLVERREELKTELQKLFPAWFKALKVFTPKRSNRTRGYYGGAPFTKIEYMEFNPGNRYHIVDRLKVKYGWEPKDFTDSGEPVIDDVVIKKLPYPEAPVIAEYLTIKKRLGQLSDGKEAWLVHVQADGRIYGYVNTNGTVTGRMTHSKPNLAQVPKADVNTPYGEACRALFRARPGYKLVGCDAASLEMRMLAHYMGRWDGGAYGRTVTQGNSEDGTDPHTINQLAIGCSSRALGKRWFYAFIYGAGDALLGEIILDGSPGDAWKLGKKTRARFKKNLPALGKLIDKLEESIDRDGFFLGLDGRKVEIRSKHSALNFLLQGAGAIVMKMAMVILDNNLMALGLTNTSDDPEDYDYEFVLNIHDEWQIEVKDKYAETVGKMAADAIRLAGEHFKMRCPLAGEYKIGQNWAETH